MHHDNQKPTASLRTIKCKFFQKIQPKIEIAMLKTKQSSANSRFFQFRIESEIRIHKNYRVGLIASVLYSFFLLNQKTKSEYIISSFKKILTTPIVSTTTTKNNTKLFYSIPRKDYLEIIDFVVDEFSKNNTPPPSPCQLSLNNKASSIREIFLSLIPAFNFARAHSAGIVDKIYIFSCYLYLLKGFIALERAAPEKPEKAIFFNSSNFPESLLCEFYRSSGVKTFSLQHGMYLRPGHISFDIINFSNTVANTLLCWGKASKEEIESFYKENALRKEFSCEVAGYPRKNHQESIQKRKTEQILILLPRATYKQESMALLNILFKIKKFDFLIKPHPSLTGDRALEELYQKLGAKIATGTLSETLESTEFKAIIGFNSTSIFEAIHNARVYVYKSGRDEFLVDCLDNFSSCNELSKLLHSPDKYTQEAKAHMMSYFFGPSKTKYLEIIAS